MAIRPAITAKEMAAFVSDYQAAFPQWEAVGGDTLVRVGGVVAQVIWFDRLRTGSYRPTCRVHVLAAPGEKGGTVVLSQFLGVKYRSITPRAHPGILESVVREIKSEIIPAISKPLDAVNVAELLSDRAYVRPVDAYALAFLYAALGRNDDAKRWIAEYHKAFRELEMPEQPSDKDRVELLDHLGKWIDCADSEDQLAAIVTQESAKLLAS